jgi:Family of unknown function (DUF6069)
MFLNPSTHLEIFRQRQEELLAALECRRMAQSGFRSDEANGRRARRGLSPRGVWSSTKGEAMTRHTRRRIGTVVLSPVAALAAWALMRLMEIDLVVSVGDGTVGPTDVFAAALLGALGGWAVVRPLERTSRYPRRLWSFLGSTALAVSVIGPMWFSDGASSVALIALHFVVAIIVIGGFGGTLAVRARATQPAPG